jgi:hypothetical protein
VGRQVSSKGGLGWGRRGEAGSEKERGAKRTERREEEHTSGTTVRSFDPAKRKTDFPLKLTGESIKPEAAADSVP